MSSNINENNYSNVKKNRNVIFKKVIDATRAPNVDPCNPESVSRKLLGKSPLKKSIGSGVYGKAYVYPAGNNKFLCVKLSKTKNENLIHEFATMKILAKRGHYCPMPYTIRSCGVSMMYYQYANGGDLKKYLKTLLNFKREDAKAVFILQVKSIVTQVLMHLHHLQKEMPSFRHNDLHIQNILITKGGKTSGFSSYNVKGRKILKRNVGIMAYLHDFGFADSDNLPNESVRKTKDFYNYGIKPHSHPMYDAQFFLSSLFNEFKTVPAFAETARMITQVLPKEYLQFGSRFVNNFRLKPNVRHYLPTIEHILEHPYFEKKTINRLGQALSVIVNKRVEKKKEVSKKKEAPKNIFMNKDNDLKIKKKKCRLYKKSEIQFIAQTKGIDTKGMTVAQICDALKKKYINKV